MNLSELIGLVENDNQFVVHPRQKACKMPDMVSDYPVVPGLSGDLRAVSQPTNNTCEIITAIHHVPSCVAMTHPRKVIGWRVHHSRRIDQSTVAFNIRTNL
jgi:hypothetical protein